MNNETYEGGLSMMSEYTELLKKLRQQEEEIQFRSFTNDTTLAVGTALLQETKRS